MKPQVLVVLITLFGLISVSSSSFVGTFFDYRKVNLTVSDCDVCEIFPNTSYPNLGFFLSIEPIWTFFTKQEKQDLISSYVSSFGFPSNVHCYFHKDAQYNLEIDWKGFLEGKGGSVSIGSGYFCIGFVLENLIEFIDVDGDNLFNPRVDQVLADFSFLKLKWRKAKVRSGDYQSIETVSHDDVVKIKWSTSPMIVKLSEVDHILTPNGTLMDIQINNYPFQSKNSKLAFKAYVAIDGTEETQFSERSESDRSVVQVGDKTNRGYFSWSNKGKVTFVSPTGKPIIRPKRDEVPNDASGLVKAILGTSAQIQNMIITLQRDESDVISWNSACGYGEPPKVDRFADMIVAVVLFSLLLVPAILGAIFYRYWMKKVKSEEATPFARPLNS